MVNGKLKRQQMTEYSRLLQKRHEELLEQSDARKQEYHQKFQPLKYVKDKYHDELCQIDGVIATGLKVYDKKIAIYTKDISELNIARIPKTLDGYEVEVIKQSDPSPALTGTLNNGLTNIADVYNFYNKRPIPSGTSINNPNGYVGTLGSWWKSKTLNRIVGVTCNHVGAATNKARGYRTVTSDISCTVTAIDTSVAKPYPMASDSDTFKGSDIDYNRPSTITSISPTTFKPRDLVTIVGNSLGCRKGNSKVLFNGIEAAIKSWTFTADTFNYYWPYTAPGPKFYQNVVSTIVAIVPDTLPSGNCTVSIYVEGDTMISPAEQDGGTFSKTNDRIGELLSFLPLKKTNNIGDTSFLIPLNENNVDPRTFFRPAMTKPVYEQQQGGTLFPFNTKKWYQGMGMAKASDVIEGTMVICTGRTTGTMVFQAIDTHYTLNMNYGNYAQIEGSTVYTDGNTTSAEYIYYDSYYLNGQPHPMDLNIYHSVGGDSGSSIFTCPIDLYNQFYDYYHGQLNWIDLPVLPPVFSTKPLHFVGNTTATVTGNGGTVFGISDRYANYEPVAAMGLEPIQFYLSGEATSFSDGRFMFTIAFKNEVAKSTSSGSFTIMQTQDILMDDIELVDDNIVTDLEHVDFQMENDILLPLNLGLHIQSSSNGNVKLIATKLVRMSVSSLTSGKVSLTIPFGTIQVGLTASSISSGNATIKLFVPLQLRADSSSASTGNINTMIITVYNLQLMGNDTSLGKINVLVMPVGWKPSSQYEEIHFEITSSINLNFEITRSLDLNLAV